MLVRRRGLQPSCFIDYEASCPVLFWIRDPCSLSCHLEYLKCDVQGSDTIHEEDAVQGYCYCCPKQTDVNRGGGRRGLQNSVQRLDNPLGQKLRVFTGQIERQTTGAFWSQSRYLLRPASRVSLQFFPTQRLLRQERLSLA